MEAPDSPAGGDCSPDTPGTGRRMAGEGRGGEGMRCHHSLSESAQLTDLGEKNGRRVGTVFKLVFSVRSVPGQSGQLACILVVQ